MAYSGNRGEWSELYTFFKLLADGKLYSGDGNLKRYEDRYFPILEIFRDDAEDRNTYKINAAKNNILVAGQSIQLEVSQERFKIQAQELLEFIKGMEATTATNPAVENFMREIDCGKISAKSTDKADIRIVIHNLTNGTKPELGYSIKSKLGSDSTLINSSVDNTNFIFRINGINDALVEQFNSLKKFKAKFDLLTEAGATVDFMSVATDELHNNLTMLDLGIERIIAECLLQYYSGHARSIEDAAVKVTEKDPLGIAKINTSQPMYEYKIKQFLLAFALGMTAASPWNGKFNANGGFIVVKEDGDIVCYHFFDRNDLEDYLFLNTRFETPSTKRHQFGTIYEQNGEYRLKLNLQVRFKG
ncbi:MAG: HpaII family restriction endonuclease [Muribaculaceae bacterium]|nr:HpaII family restriction endonuclease [Muribaculaceae bacterium]